MQCNNFNMFLLTVIKLIISYLACRSGWYKLSLSNDNWVKCPENTESADNNTVGDTCVCKDGHYKLASDLNSELSSPCYGKTFYYFW